MNLQTLKKVKPTHPLLLNKIEAIIFWRKSKKSNTTEIFLPNNVSAFGLTINGELLVNYDNYFKKMPSFGTRNILAKPSEIKTNGDFFNISIRLLLPNTLSVFTKIPMSEIYKNEFFSLTDIFNKNEVDTLVDQILEQQTDEQIQEIIERFLVAKIITNTNFVFESIINFIHNMNGNLNMYQIAQKFNISERTINRYFNAYAGINPNKYINLIRFRAVINTSNSTSNILTTAIDVGYYDQSHFIKHFKEFTTLTPTNFYEKENKTVVSDFYNTLHN
jgi:AraC-like DNA-binding protein